MSLLNRFPRTHALYALLIAVPLVSLILADRKEQQQYHHKHARPTQMNIVPLPFADGTIEELTQWSRDRLLPADKNGDAIANDVEDALGHVERVRRGDTLARIFDRAGLSANDLVAVIESGPVGKALAQIHPGRELTFLVTSDKRLVKLSYAVDALQTLEFERKGESFSAKLVARAPIVTSVYHHGTIDQSLFAANQQIGLTDDVTLKLAQIFQYDIDFVLDLRKGDQFSLLLEEKHLDGKFIGYGKILAAEFVNQGERYRAVFYSDLHGDGDYYSDSGRSMRKAFLRAPVDFSRISSNFNPTRFHPIQKRVMPHRGIDYAAPTGTPVYASGNGRVLQASRSEPNGNFIVIQHERGIQTKYLHLSRFGNGISPGSLVRQGQIIGFVGATGWATAPHLHYEFLVHGVHQNPRTVELPKADPVPSSERARFNLVSGSRFALLDNQGTGRQLAVAQ